MLELKELYNLKQTNLQANKVILFIHGNSHSSKTFDSNFGKTLLKNFNYVTYDLLGHGEAARLDDYSMSSFTHQLKNILEYLNGANKDVYIVGQSLGGHIALQALLGPSNLCKKLFVYGTPALEKPLTLGPFLEVPEMALLLQEHLSQNDALQLRSKFIANPEKYEEFQLRDILATDSKFRTSFLPKVLAGDYEDEINIVHSMKNQVNLAFGNTDALISKEYYQNKLSTFPLKIFNGAGHNIHQDNPEEFFTYLLSYFCE